MIQLDYTNIRAERVGKGNGLSAEELKSAIRHYGHISLEIKAEQKNGQLPFLDLPYQDVSDIESFARRRAKRFKNFVILGIGGSALGAKALHTALRPPFYNLLTPRERRHYPRFFVLDNIDPVETSALFDLVNPRETLFNVISKSGNTPETLADFLVALDLLKRKTGRHYKKHLVITTGHNNGFLLRITEQEGLTSFEFPEGVEGRYSVLSAMGLVSAACTGINIRKVLVGARAVAERCRKSKPENNPAYQAALINFLLDTRKGKNIVVLMPYATGLKDVADWFRQLWAESLGKRYNLQGNEVFTGPTPINALGVTDQHSQIQLYNEGPNNKLIVFMQVEKFRSNVKIPRLGKLVNSRTNELVNSLQGKAFNDLMRAEKKGTEMALTQNQRPNYTLTLPHISEETIGGLLYFWELATAYAGKLYNVNAFNQPGVEAGKKATAEILSNKPS